MFTEATTSIADIRFDELSSARRILEDELLLLRKRYGSIAFPDKENESLWSHAKNLQKALCPSRVWVDVSSQVPASTTKEESVAKIMNSLNDLYFLVDAELLSSDLCHRIVMELDDFIAHMNSLRIIR